MEVTKEYTRKINDALDNFDFEAVNKVMTFLDWKWGCSEKDESVPTVSRLRKEIRRQLEQCVICYRPGNTDSFIETGGFRTELYFIDGVPEFRVAFYVADYCTEDGDCDDEEDENN